MDRTLIPPRRGEIFSQQGAPTLRMITWMEGITSESGESTDQTEQNRLDILILSAQIAVIEAQIVAINIQIAAINAQIIIINAAIVVIEADIAVIEAKIIVIEAQIVVIEAKIIVIEAKIVVIEAQIVVITQDIVDIKLRLDALEDLIPVPVLTSVNYQPQDGRNENVKCNNTSPIDITLPTNPISQQQVSIKRVGGVVNLIGNGRLIDGMSTIKMTRIYTNLPLTYTLSTDTWDIQ